MSSYANDTNQQAEKEFNLGYLAQLEDAPPLEDPSKPVTQRLWPVFAAGAGLFSDGYLQAVIGPVNKCLSKIYGPEYSASSAQQNVTSIAFAGTVLGQLIFGFTSDAWSRKNSLLISTLIMFVFAALGAGAYGAGGSTSGLFAALTAYRFLLGVGLGGEYPAGSVTCAESSGEMKEGTRNRWFALATNVQIDFGFVVGYIVPMIIASATSNLTVVWRLSLAIGAVPPFLFIFFRAKLDEPEAFKRQKKSKIPYWLGLKYYWFRLVRVALIWAVYDFVTYPFSIYSTSWLSVIAPEQALWQTFGWGTLINFFYLPGAILGAFTSDWMGPKRALIVFLALQGALGFLMAGLYYYLKMPQNIAAFVVLYGLFLAIGEMGPGDNIGLIASKTTSTRVRGGYYAVAAATGKIGGFVGNYIFPLIQDDAGSDEIKLGQYPFFVSCSLIFGAALIALTLPHIGQDSIEKEDAEFNAYLAEQGWKDE